MALISTGDELRNPGKPLDAGGIDDSNRAGLAVNPAWQPVAALGTFYATLRCDTEGPFSGEWTARITGAQGAGILRSRSEANALLVLAHDQGSVAAGELVEVRLFDEPRSRTNLPGQ